MINTTEITKNAIMSYIREYGNAAARCEEYNVKLEYWIKRKNEYYESLEKIINRFLEDKKECERYDMYVNGKIVQICNKCGRLLTEVETHGGKKYLCSNCGEID